MNQTYKQTRIWAWARRSWIGESVRACRRCRREFWAWARFRGTPLASPGAAQLAESMTVLHAHASSAANGHRSDEAPVFLLSNGMRSGSTLLQRILVTDPRLLLWGEPLGEMTVVSAIADMLAHPLRPWVSEVWKQQVDLTSSSLATSWIADLYPPADDFLLALRALFERWLCEPARRSGFARWGFKEIRLGATEAVLLHWLYPRAKFVILSRHPYDCYRSMADSKWDSYFRYPDAPIDCAAKFAREWNRLALSWSELPVGFPSFHIKYEDLICGKVNFRELESWLGLEIKESVALSVSVGGTAARQRLSWYERFIIAREAAAGMRALGYSG
jgi:hypothetical protein